MHDPNSAKLTVKYDVHADFIPLGRFAPASGQQTISNPI